MRNANYNQDRQLELFESCILQHGKCYWPDCCCKSLTPSVITRTSTHNSMTKSRPLPNQSSEEVSDETP